MSDDIPTQRIPAAGDVPTQRLPVDGGTSPALAEEQSRSRGLLIGLIIAGALLIIAIIVLLVFLLGGGGKPVSSATGIPSTTPSSSPTVSATPSATPTPTPTPTPSVTSAAPVPPSTKAKITSFTAPATVQCNNKTGNPVEITFSWTSTNGLVAYFGVNTDDPKNQGMGWTLPPSGSTSDFPSGYFPYDYPCYAPSVTYVLEVEGSDGSTSIKKVTVTNTGDQHS